MILKKNRKKIAIVCAIAMLVAGLTYAPSQKVKADEPNWETVEWAGNGVPNSSYGETYKFYSAEGSLVNIQQPGFATDAGFYVTFPAAISGCSLGNYDIQGAGIIIHLSNFTKKVTEFTVTYGENTSTCYVYYKDGQEDESSGDETAAVATEGNAATDESLAATTEEITAMDESWKSIENGNNQWYYNESAKQDINSVVNIQKPGFADEEGVYITVPSEISEISVNGKTEGVGAIQGAGAIVYLSSMTKYINEVTFTRVTGTSYIQIMNTEGIKDDYLDVSEYKSNNTYPIKDGYVFGGWFADSNFTTAYTEDIGYAYAKFVDENVLRVKFQNSYDSNGDINAIRFVSSIDSTDYEKLGFIFSGTYGNKTISEKDKEVTGIYSSITAGNEKIYPSVFSASSKYFFTYTVRNLNGVSSSWTVKPYWVTLDGTKVIGIENKLGTSEETTTKDDITEEITTIEATTTKEIVTEEATTQEVTTKETTTIESTYALDDVSGLVYAGNDSLPYYFAWAPSSNQVDGYYVYINGVKVTTVAGTSVNLESSYFTNSGTYTIGVQAYKGNEISRITTCEYTVKSGGEVTTASSSGNETTIAGETENTAEVTTNNPTTIAMTTTAAATTTTAATEVTTKATVTFTTDTSLEKPFGLVLSNVESGYITVVWGKGTINCYNVYVDNVRVKTKVTAASYNIPVQTEGTHTVGIATVNSSAKTESEWTTGTINVVGTAEAEVETTAMAEEDMPQIDESIEAKDGKMILQLNNQTNGQYSDDQIYWLIVGRNPNNNNNICYVDANGDLQDASESLNDKTIGSKKYASCIIHTLAEVNYAYLPAITSGRMYISYGEPVYIQFNGSGSSAGYAGPDINNSSDPNKDTLFEFVEFTTELSNDSITFHGNTTRVDYFSFPVITRLTDEYGSYDRCVGDLGTRAEIFSAFASTVSEPFQTLVTDKRIMAPAKLTFKEDGTYSTYFDDYINRFWTKYSSENLTYTSEGATYVGKVSSDGNLHFTKNGAGDYIVEKPSTQDVLEGRGAFDKASSEANRIVELAIEAQLCAAFNRGIAMNPENWGTVSTFYEGDSIYNEYAAFFHEHSVSGRAYGFCYDDVADQSTLVECGNAARLTIDLKW